MPQAKDHFGSIISIDDSAELSTDKYFRLDGNPECRLSNETVNLLGEVYSISDSNNGGYRSDVMVRVTVLYHYIISCQLISISFYLSV